MKMMKIMAVAILLVSGASFVKAATPEVNKLVKAYLSVKDALVADNANGAGARAKLFTDAVKVVNGSKLDAAQKAIWTKYAEKLRANGEQISKAADIERQREHFLKLSEDFYAVVKALKANDVTLYRQYCPMKKGAWLSESTDILNPYYGKEMLECGMVKETLKAN